MKNLTKFEASMAQIRAAFAGAGLGEVCDIVELSDGWYNRIFAATATDGKKYVLKLAPQNNVRVLTHERNMMAMEIEYYRLINDKTNIKTPKIIHFDCSKTIVPTDFFVMEFLDGQRLDKMKLTPQEEKQVAAEWARILAEFHQLRGEGFGYAQVGLEGNWADGLRKMTQILINDATAFGKNCPVGKRLLEYIDSFRDVLGEVPCVLVNFDLHSMNIFCARTADGDIELSILDLERCFWGDPVGDFVSVEVLAPFEKKRIIEQYNNCAKNIISKGKNEKIRYYLLCAYLATIMYTERFSRFEGAGKVFNPVYLAGTVGYIMLARQAFRALKKLQK